MKNDKEIKSLFERDLSDEAIEQYIKDYFPKNTHAPVEETIKSLLEFIRNQELIQEICRTPILLQAVCFTWMNKPIPSLMNTNKTIATFYQNTLFSLTLRHLYKFDQAAKNYNDTLAFGKGQFELAFLEHFAFRLMHNHSLTGELTEEKNYMNSEQFQQVNQEFFKFFIATDNQDNFSESSRYYFNHISLQHFFCARYFISCINTELKYQQKLTPYPHKLDSMSDCKMLAKYIQLHIKNEWFQRVWEFMEELLILYNDQKALNYFQNSKVVGNSFGNEFINELARLNFEFNLQRSDGNTLVISYQKCNIRKSIQPNLDELKNRLNFWLYVNQLTNQVTLREDPADFILTLKSDTAEVMDNILMWLIQITSILPTAPMQTKKNKFPLFFTWKDELSTTKNDENIKSIECRLQ